MGEEITAAREEEEEEKRDQRAAQKKGAPHPPLVSLFSKSIDPKSKQKNRKKKAGDWSFYCWKKRYKSKFCFPSPHYSTYSEIYNIYNIIHAVGEAQRIIASPFAHPLLSFLLHSRGFEGGKIEKY